MFDIKPVSPLEGMMAGGRFGAVTGGRPAFTLRVVPHLSICRVQALDIQEEEKLKSCLKGMLGLNLPLPHTAFTAGTRVALRAGERADCLIVTEGEAESVLYHRLYTPLTGTCAVFDVTHGILVMRFEGAGSEEILKRGALHDLSLSACPEGSVQEVDFDGVRVCVHRSERDRWMLYIPRSYAQIMYTWLVQMCLPRGIQLYAS